ncbi:MAG: oligoendopeptidase F [Chlamydiae bacterium]|nr:oligoendopeptidase F [Chlamydiota bacterium]
MTFMYDHEDVSRWDLKPLYNDERAWDQNYEKMLKQGFEAVIRFRGELGKDPKNLEASLDAFFDFNQMLEKLYTYAHLLSDGDISDQQNLMRLNQARSLYSDFDANTSWMRSEILKIPHLQPKGKYARYLERILLSRPHTLNEEEEKILSLCGVTQRSSSLFSILNNVELKFDDAVDSTGEKYPLTLASYQNLVKSSDRTLRQSAFTNLFSSFEKVKLTLSENYYQKVLENDFYRKVRKFDSSMEAALFSNEIPLSVYATLLETVEKKENLKQLHRYVQWKGKVLGLKNVHPYDLYAEPFEEVEVKFSLDEAIGLVLESIRPLGEEYVAIAEKGLKKERWVDWFERPGKRSGAYSSGYYKSHPYILMNFTGSIRDLFTLAHELGHSMHSYYSNKNQPYPYASYTIFVAEVASTFHEELLYNLLMKKIQDPKVKQYYLHYKAEAIRATVHRQTLFAHFEKQAHGYVENKGVLTADYICGVFNDLYRKYYGDSFVIDPLLGVEALRIPHFYSSFYVYQYAIGMSASLALHANLLKDPVEGKKRYLEFISSGSSKKPVDILKDANVDVRDPNTIQKALDAFKQLVDQLDT